MSKLNSLVLSALALSLGVQVGLAQPLTPTSATPPVRHEIVQPATRDVSIIQLRAQTAQDASQQEQTATPKPDPKELERIYLRAWETVADRYYDPAKLKDFGTWKQKFDGKLTTNEELDAAIKQMVGSLNDTWTSYRSPADQAASTERESKNIVYLGTWLKRNSAGGYTINYVSAFTPAYNSPLRRGDEIKSIDGKPLKGLAPREVDALTDGTVGSQKQIVFTHGGVDETTTVTMSRATTPPSAVRVLPGDILYLKLPEFQVAPLDELSRLIDEVLAANQQEIKGVILDLRGNPGGLVEQAKRLCYMFIGGNNVILDMKERHGSVVEEQKFRSLTKSHSELDAMDPSVRRRHEILQDKPMIVLVDGTSASSAEITTAALKDSKRATVLGETTWGKGVAWQETTLSNGGVLRYTMGALTAPNGYQWTNVGLNPDVTVERPRNSSVDAQLNAAVERLQKASAPTTAPAKK